MMNLQFKERSLKTSFKACFQYLKYTWAPGTVQMAETLAGVST